MLLVCGFGRGITLGEFACEEQGGFPNSFA